MTTEILPVTLSMVEGYVKAALHLVEKPAFAPNFDTIRHRLSMGGVSGDPEVLNVYGPWAEETTFKDGRVGSLDCYVLAITLSAKIDMRFLVSILPGCIQGVASGGMPVRSCIVCRYDETNTGPYGHDIDEGDYCSSCRAKRTQLQEEVALRAGTRKRTTNAD